MRFCLIGTDRCITIKIQRFHKHVVMCFLVPGSISTISRPLRRTLLQQQNKGAFYKTSMLMQLQKAAQIYHSTIHSVAYFTLLKKAIVVEECDARDDQQRYHCLAHKISADFYNLYMINYNSTLTTSIQRLRIL